MVYIASQTPEEILNILQDKYKININPDLFLGGEYPHNPGRTMICKSGNILISHMSMLPYSSMTNFLQI